MKRSLLFFIYRYLIPYGGLLLVKALAATYRIKLYDPENEKNVLDGHKSLVYASWQAGCPHDHFGSEKMGFQ